MYLTELKKIQTFIFDVDGVFTDGSVFVNENGDLLRTMNIRDGYATKKAVRSGLQIIVITGGNSQGVVTRLNRLGVEKVFTGVQDKIAVLNELVDSGVIDLSTTAYMGDDMPDLKIMSKVSFKCCPSDAIPEIIEIADYVSSNPGGRGSVRDVLEKWLKLNEKWGA